jgi:hypothetical protein
MKKLRGAWRSWTIHFNVYMAALIEGVPVAKDSFPELQPYIPAHLFQYGMTALVIGNLILRFRTSTALEHK